MSRNIKFQGIFLFYTCLIAVNKPAEPSPIIIPAAITPSEIAIILFLKSRSSILAAKVPVQAPVPGTGIATNKNNAK